MTARTCRVRFRKVEALAIWIVLAVDRNKSRDTKTAKVFLANFRTWALRCNHDDGDVFADLHAFFNDVEAV